MNFIDDMSCDKAKCPTCGSEKISEIATYQCNIERNIKTGKVLSKDTIDRGGTIDFWQYKCRECGWKSECFTS